MSLGGLFAFQFRRYFSSMFYSNAFLPFALSVPFAFSGIALGIWARVDGLKVSRSACTYGAGIPDRKCIFSSLTTTRLTDVLMLVNPILIMSLLCKLTW